MTTEKGNSKAKLERLIRRNSELLAENNRLLKKMYRHALWSFWVRMLWYTVMVGLPFIFYFYVLEPYVATFGSSYETFVNGMNVLPVLQDIEQLLQGGQ